MVTVWLSLAQMTCADEAMTARNKALVREFYTTVLIERKIDAAPRFLRTDYIQHNPCAYWIERFYGSVPGPLRPEASARL
jgi:hypothetical protein